MNLLKKVSVVLIITLFFFSINVYAQKGGQNLPDDPLTKIHILALNDWTAGSVQMCSWEWGKMTGNVKLTLWKGNQLVATLSPSCPVGMNGRGSFTILVPTNLTPGEYELRLVSLSNPQIGDRRILKIIDKSTPKLSSPGSIEHKDLKISGDHKDKIELKYEHKTPNEIKVEHKTEVTPK
jgi:hypothetical protein